MFFKFLQVNAINGTRNIIFTGHSLGGGLAKLLGVKYNKQSISFSGPGVTPLEIEYSKKNNNHLHYTYLFYLSCALKSILF